MQGEAPKADGLGPSPRWRAVTAKDVAAAAGVHQSTVSRSLDPRQIGKVTPETRRRVLEVASRLGYRPDYTASSLRRQRSMTIGVLTASFSNPLYGELMHAIGSELERAGYLALILEDPDGSDRLAAAFRTLQERRVDGIICTSARTTDTPTLKKAAAAGMPIVLALRWTAEAGLPCVLNDDLYGATIAAQHLLNLGHRRLVELPGPQHIMTFEQRSRGFRQTLRAAGAHLVEHSAQARTPSVPEGRRVMRELFAGGELDGVTAVFAHNDSLAIGGADVLRERGVRCPAEVSLLGYNDDALTDHLNPPLSTVRMPIGEIGRLAARRILQEVTSEGQLGDVLSLTPELVSRASTGRAVDRAENQGPAQ